MVKYFICGIVLFLLASCKQWDTRKVSVDQVVHDEWKAISMSEVDTYPTFDSCNHLDTKDKLRDCFETEITAAFYNAISSNQIIVQKAVDDTVWVDFIVNEKGKICLDSIHNTALVRREIPELSLWIHQATIDMPIAHPADKRGVPVKVRFKIPVVLKVD